MKLLHAPALVTGTTFLLLSHVASGAVTVKIDGSDPHQVMEGFGATTLSLAYAAKDNVRADLRPKALQAVYRDVGLNMGNLELEPFESSTANVFAPANDDADPASFNANGFNWIQSDNLVDKVVTPAKQYGFDNYYLGPVISTGYALSWVNALRSSDYQRFLDEIAEHVLAAVTHWRDAYSITPRYLQLWNEPLSGNRELSGGSPQELVDIVKRTGTRLIAAGFTPRFVVPAEETESISLSNASLILGDAAARPFVGAIAYHPYPYGSTYASVPNILSSSGSGAPSATAIAVRNSLRDLGAKYNVPVFMVEVSHSDLSFDDFEGVRGRAIQIHDELEYADASAFFGMNALWDSTSHAEHFAGRADPGFYSETDTIALVDNDTGTIRISPMGHAIGHYARWIRRGAVRLGATSSDPLLQISAFADRAKGRAVVVAINNAATALTVDVSLTGLTVSGTASGEQSTASAVWAKLPDRPVTASTPFEFSAPARSITTWSLPLLGALADAGAPSDDAGAQGGAPGSAGGVPSTGGATGGAPSTGRSAGGNGGGGARGTLASGGTAADAEAPTGGETDSGARTDSGKPALTRPSDGANCTCHTAPRPSSPSPEPGVAVVLLGLLLGRRARRGGLVLIGFALFGCGATTSTGAKREVEADAGLCGGGGAVTNVRMSRAPTKPAPVGAGGAPARVDGGRLPGLPANPCVSYAPPDCPGGPRPIFGCPIVYGPGNNPMIHPGDTLTVTLELSDDGLAAYSCAGVATDSPLTGGAGFFDAVRPGSVQETGQVAPSTPPGTVMHFTATVSGTMYSASRGAACSNDLTQVDFDVTVE